MSVEGLDDELRVIYNDLNNPQTYGKKFGPEQNRYSGPQVRDELVAEAVRAYMSDPNYMKSVAPETAARIREVVNSNPDLKHTIQFNASGVPFGVLDGDEQWDRALREGNAI
jgi:hypothetical protein